ncbi:MAG: PKD domain-containing protein, partial [Paracoccaceae bacterium]
AARGGGQRPTAAAQTQPLTIVNGPDAASRVGDANKRDRFYISVPADAEGRFYVRLYDPDLGGAHDTLYAPLTTETTRFQIKGGEGAFTASARPGPLADGARALGTPEDDDVGGEVLVERDFGDGPLGNEAWVALAPFEAAQGEIVGDRAYFRFDVLGIEGNDGNVFAFEVSRSADASVSDPDVRILAYSPTLRWPDNTDGVVEIPFEAREGMALTVQNFDAASADIDLVSTFETLPLASSGQDRWASDTVTVPPGRTTIQFGGGQERPNDFTITLFDDDGVAQPFLLPARLVSRATRPSVTGIAQPLANCRSVAFDAADAEGPGRLSVLWSFGDGTTSDEAVIVHQYETPGLYTATLDVTTDAPQTARAARSTVEVLVRDAPVAAPGEDIVAAPGDEIVFDAAGSVPSDQPIARYLWSFGDGERAEGALVTKTYERSGLYRAVLRVEDDAEHPCNFGIAQRLVTINAPPVAEAGEGRSYAIGEEVTFRGAASYDVDGEITRYDWDFGDGNGAETATATHAFQEPGIYTARLTVTDDSGVGNATDSDTVTLVVNAPPEPVSTRPERAIAVGEVTAFDARESTDPDGEILSYFWEFGDGAVGEGPLVDYAYAAPGTYQVRLTVRDDSATRSDTSVAEFDVVVSAAPVADAGPDQLVTASEVLFDGGGSRDTDGEITVYEWDLGDGATATGRTVRHAYAQPGDYEITLTVRDDSGAPLNVDSDTTALRINETPIADAGPDDRFTVGEEFVLDGSASLDPDGRIAEYIWRFEDGTEKTGQRIVHAFAEPGLHRVALTVIDDTGHDAARDTDEVAIRINAAPVANAGPDLLTEPGAEIVLDGGNSFDPDGEIISYRWDFSDLGAPVFEIAPTRVYEVAGTYTAQLTVVDDSETQDSLATDVVSIRVNQSPTAEAGPEILSDRLRVSLDGSASSDPDGDALVYTWDLGDNSPPKSGARISHTYPFAGVFPVTLTVDDGTGLGNATAVDATQVVIGSRPIAEAGGAERIEVCSGETVIFDGSDSFDPDGGPLRYSWAFGDGETSDLVNPTKIYEQPGSYQVSLTVRDESGSPRGVHTDTVAVIVEEAPIADAGEPITACTNETVRFDGSGSTDADGAVNLFSWNFGDGSTAGGERPTHIYERPGTYRVELRITGDTLGSCDTVDTDETTVTVIEAPRVRVDGPARVATGQPATWRADFAGAGGTDAGDVTFLWDYGTGETDFGEEVSYAFIEPGRYQIALSAVRDIADTCAEVGTRLNVVVNAEPDAVPDFPAEVSVGESVLFDGSASTDPDGAITRYDWAFGDGATGTGAQARYRFPEAGTYTVRLNVTDDAGVANSTASREAQITVNPTPTAGLEPPAPLCPGAAHRFAASGAGTATWRFGDEATAEGVEVSHSFATPGIYPVSVTLDDGRGLANSVNVETVPVRVNRPPVAEAGPDRLLCPGDAAVFDARASTDLDGRITAYEWRFSDGVTMSGPLVERVFERPETVTAELTVTDDSGAACAVASDTARIRVNAAPIVDAGPDLEGFVGAAHDVFTFAPRRAEDPDGDGVALLWDLGDGAERTGAEVKHRYEAPGSYGVRLIAQDGTGLDCGIASDTLRVRAEGRP